MKKSNAKERQKFIHRHCEGKRRFTSRRKARYIAERMTTKKRVLFVAYKCQHCGFYHIGHEKTSFRVWLLTPHHRVAGLCGR